MAEADLQRFLDKVRQLNAFVAQSEQEPQLRTALSACRTHGEVVALARACGFEIGRRWGEGSPPAAGAENLLVPPCPEPGSEETTLLVETAELRLERIHSCQASSPEGFWYDQEDHEWVTLLQGSARLRFEDETGPRELNRGDSLLIRAHRRHRLLATDPPPGSVWLALFWREG
jgi:cupin 2 domain-containing protein